MRALLVVMVLWAVPSAALADKASKARADKLFEDGRGYLERKEYALACTAFEQSQQAEASVGTQLNLALCYEEWGKLAAAYRAYIEAEKQAKKKKDNRDKIAHKKVSEIEPKLARLRVSIPPSADPYSIFLFDEKELSREDLVEEQLIDAGKHTVEVRIAGAPPKVTTIAIKGGERKSVEIELPVPAVVTTTTTTTTPPPKHEDPAPVVVTTTVRPRNKARLYGGLALIGAGTLTAGFAGYLAMNARSDYNTAIANCPDNTCTSHVDYDATQNARKQANMASVVAGAGAVAIVAGVFLALMSKGPAAKVEKVSHIQPLVTNGGFGLAIGGSL